MKHLFDNVSIATSRITTKTYSTSFALGINCLDKHLHEPIYGIYGFVRFADEIVDTFHDYDKPLLLKEFKEETYKAIERGISMNPILNSFQAVVNRYHIERELIDCFLQSMETDLSKTSHNGESYKQYILGSAEVVGLMCLRVFTNGDEQKYRQLKDAAIRLGAAFQKVNFLRDLNYDSIVLGRSYFPGINTTEFSEEEKDAIISDIESDFREALAGIRRLPKNARFGVYVAYVYYYTLFQKIRNTPLSTVISKRIRVSNYQKIGLLAASYFKHRLKLI